MGGRLQASNHFPHIPADEWAASSVQHLLRLVAAEKTRAPEHERVREILFSSSVEIDTLQFPDADLVVKRYLELEERQFGPKSHSLISYALLGRV